MCVCVFSKFSKSMHTPLQCMRPNPESMHSFCRRLPPQAVLDDMSEINSALSKARKKRVVADRCAADCCCQRPARCRLRCHDFVALLTVKPAAAACF